MTPAWLTATPFAVFDLETTGPEPETARIVQVGVLQIDNGEITDRWSALVDPQCPIPEGASQVHGIYDADVAHAPTWEVAAPKFLERIKGRGLVGYNARRYDWPIVLRQMNEVGLQARERQVLDVCVWSKHIDRGGLGKGYHKLENMAERWGVALDNAHDALGDCEATWGVLCALGPDLPAVPIREFLQRQERIYQADQASYARWLARKKAKEAAESATRANDVADRVIENLGGGTKNVRMI